MDAPDIGRKYKLDTLVDAISMDATYTTCVLCEEVCCCLLLREAAFHLENSRNA